VFRNMAVVLLAVFVSVPALSAFAGQTRKMWEPATDQQIDRALDTLQQSLNLTPTQATTVHQLALTRRDNMRAAHEQARPKLQQLMSLLKQPDPDPAAVGRVVIDLKATHEQARMKQADIEKQFFAILNPTQQQTVNDLRKDADTFTALQTLGLLSGSGGSSSHPHQEILP
jgi:Spy/CpxP family protein refolding chaperone